MNSLSAVLIVKNEASNLAACLKTLDWVDEIIVLDSGSTDDTCSIAESFGAKVHVRDDWAGFGEQRLRAQRLATSEWVFMIDADERVTPELQQSIMALIQGGPAIGRIARLSWCFGGFIRHAGWYPDWIDRVYPRELAQYNTNLVHEKLENIAGLPVQKLQGDLLHYTYDSMNHYLTKSAHYAELWAEARDKKGKKGSLGSALIHGIGCFLRMYLFRLGFLDGRQGLLLALLSAHSTFVKHADLWVRQQAKNNEGNDE